jgi:hypothetical protein
MKGRRYSPEQVVRSPSSAGGRSRRRCGTEDVVRLKQLEKENARLKRIVADQALDINMLRDVARANF